MSDGSLFPDDIYFSILPYLPVSDLGRIACVNRQFAQLTSSEAFWKRKVHDDFDLSSIDTTKLRINYKTLYIRLYSPQVFLWPGPYNRDENGLPAPFPRELRLPRGVHVKGFASGGWSFHTLDTRGRIYACGTLDGMRAHSYQVSYISPFKSTEGPMLLRLPVRFRTVSAGRIHSTALDTNNNVWTFVSWGRPFRLSSPLLDRSSPETTAKQVICGWAFSAVLTDSGDVLVFWPHSDPMKAAITHQTRVFHKQNPVHIMPTADQPSIIPCHPYNLRGVDPIKLSPMVTGDLPELQGTGATVEGETEIVKIAGLEHSIIGLTNKGHVLIHHVGDEGRRLRGQWQYLPEFSEVGLVRQHATFTRAPEVGRVQTSPPETMHITHISAHFRSFAAYSTGHRSVVMIGNVFNEHVQAPVIVPELQDRGVTSVVVGDWHFGAVTADGKLFTWGAHGNGALGYPTTQRTVTVPTEVRFDYGEGRQQRERFCIAAAAAGWQTGALVVDLEPEDSSEAEVRSAVATDVEWYVHSHNGVAVEPTLST